MVFEYISAAALLNTLLCIIIHIIIGQCKFYYLRTNYEQSCISKTLIIVFILFSILEVAIASYNYYFKYKYKFCSDTQIKLKELKGVIIQKEDAITDHLGTMNGEYQDISGHWNHQRKDGERDLRYKYNEWHPDYWVIWVKTDRIGYELKSTDYSKARKVKALLKEAGFNISNN